MILLILFDVYIILGVALAISIHKDGYFTSETCSPYVLMGIVTVMWLPWVIEGTIQYVKCKNN